jgi:hypothetical protein
MRLMQCCLIRHAAERNTGDAGRTHVIESGVGYGEGPDFDAMYGHFRSCNAEEFAAPGQRFVKGPIDWREEAQRMQKSVATRASH